MGDSRRFKVVAEFMARNIRDRNCRIADVAAGKGRLSAALQRLGFTNIDSWEPQRRKNVHHSFIRKLFTLYDAEEYDVIVGLHPDEATEEIICGSAKFGKKMFLIPCCAMPVVTARYAPSNNWSRWCDHLLKICHRRGLETKRTVLPFRGKNIMIWSV